MNTAMNTAMKTWCLSIPSASASVLAIATAIALAACASKPKQEANALLEKYPHCYHTNIKISNKCIEKNENGEKISALEIENTAFPGQYK